MKKCIIIFLLSLILWQNIAFAVEASTSGSADISEKDDESNVQTDNETDNEQIDDEANDEEPYEIEDLLSALETSASVSNEPETYSAHIVAIDRATSRVLYEKDAYSTTPMASTTKIMTAILALENCSLDDVVTISSNAAHTSGSTLGIYTDTQMTMRDLLYGLMLRSGNDCAVAIAEFIGGTVENFAVLMNEKAEELGMDNTNFVTPNGLDDDNHYTTAYELAILTDYALHNSTFQTIVGTKTATVTCGTVVKNISNTNELLGNYDGVYGVKTGFTFGAGRCLVTACKRDELDIIVVVLGADTKKIRTSDSIKVLNYVFSNYSNIDISNIIYDNFYNFENYFSNSTILTKAVDNITLTLSEPENTVFPLLDEEISKLELEIYSLSKFEAPLLAGTKIRIT